ncbi:Protein of unknown function [Nocardioides scoriae]|uniref:Lipoprotein LprG n=1 Tax=Nocardioides scoriae TaxID=642780 RepID=A0A1H1THJ5_9ACTN|nr:LppX_LprAFG lipoprotein [Nocardioides scoriae]SDS59654.1 Protein of unknown function [Nocardioides scoriae]
MRRTSKVRILAAPAVATLLVLGGCGSSDSGSSGDGGSSSAGDSSSASADAGSDDSAGSSGEELTKADFGDRIYAAFQDAGTLKFTITTSGAGSSTGTGEADLSGDQPASSVTQEVQGAGKVQAIAVDGVFYLKSAQLSGEKWLKVDPNAKDGLGALIGSLGGNSDPSKLLQVMNQASEVTAEGQEEVEGTETTKYHVVLPRKAFAATLGDNPQVVQMLPAQIEFDMWVDGDDQLRKVTYELAVGGQESGTTVTYRDFGDPVSIQAPPASETTTQAPGLGGTP